MDNLQDIINEVVAEYVVGNLPIGGEEKRNKQQKFNIAPMPLNVAQEGKIRVYNQNLCPKLWINNQLDPEVKDRLLEIAKDFYEKTNFKAPVKDIFLMGSVANYNWTPESDLDVHILIDFNDLEMPIDTANQATKTASSNWNNEHDIVIKGHKVEINFQNISDNKPHVTGIYSLLKNQWIRMPKRKPLEINKVEIIAKFNELKDYIERAILTGNREYMKDVKKYIDDYRQYGLDTKGELGTENLVFKILRSRGILKKLKDAAVDVYDQEMSLNENYRFGNGTWWWMRPNGNLENVQYQGHEDWAKKELNLSPYKSREDAVYKLLQNGFIKLKVVDGVIYYTYHPGHKLTPNQIRKLNELSNEYNYRLFDDTFHQFVDSGVLETLSEVTQKDIKQRHPVPGMPQTLSGDPDLEMMTLDNLKSLREKSAREWKYWKKKNDINKATNALKRAWLFNAEIKRRLDNINAPVMEEGYGAGIPETDRLKIKNSDGSVQRWRIRSKDAPKTPKMPTENEVKKDINELINEGVDLKNVYVGIITPDLSVKALRADTVDNPHHEYLMNLFHVDNGFSWRYRKDLNIIWWWGNIPNQDVKDALDGWIENKLGMRNPKHKIIDPMDLLGIVKKGSDYNLAHGDAPLQEIIIDKVLGEIFSNEGFDPTSVGPNPAATEGESDPTYYERENARMRQMESAKPQEIYIKSLKIGDLIQLETYPTPLVFKGFRLESGYKDKVFMRVEIPNDSTKWQEIVANKNDKVIIVKRPIKEDILLESPNTDTLKKNKRPLTDEERQQVINAGAVWNDNTPGVWKSVVNGKTWYACNTHRAIQVKPTLKGAIKAFEFIKTTS